MNLPMTKISVLSPTDQSLAEMTRETVDEYLKILGDQEPTYLYRQIMDQVERPLLEAVMQHTNGNQSKTASYLGINRATLRSKLKRHSLL